MKLAALALLFAPLISSAAYAEEAPCNCVRTSNSRVETMSSGDHNYTIDVRNLCDELIVVHANWKMRDDFSRIGLGAGDRSTINCVSDGTSRTCRGFGYVESFCVR
jgi:hypothetical protein